LPDCTYRSTRGEPDGLPEAVHGPVDHALVERLDAARGDPRDPRRAVHARVEDVLVSSKYTKAASGSRPAG